MTTTINASTSSGLVVTPDNSGNILLQYNGISTPTFGYWSNGSQACNASTTTKITFTNSEWDTTGGMYASSRFTPTFAGYYQINASTCIVSNGNSYTSIFKNGAEYKRGYQSQTGVAAVAYPVASMVYFNGTTDYIEIFFSNYGGSNQTTIGGNAYTYFNGCLLRGA
jgi:hypothetical protein